MQSEPATMQSVGFSGFYHRYPDSTNCQFVPQFPALSCHSTALLRGAARPPRQPASLACETRMWNFKVKGGGESAQGRKQQPHANIVSFFGGLLPPRGASVAVARLSASVT